MESKPTYEQAQLHLQIYEMRREARLRQARDWFFKKRFGMFTHWGIYSVAGYQEQHMYRKKVSRDQYALLMRKFKVLPVS